jgi:helicase MOV-10
VGELLHLPLSYSIRFCLLRSTKTYIGDQILVQPAGIDSGKWFEGQVYIVARDEVGLQLNRAFKAHKAKPCSIRFRLNRHPMKVQHQAMNIMDNEDRLLFPTIAHVEGETAPSPDQLEGPRFDPRIVDNAAQMQAVASIVHRKPGAVPFVVYGP